MNKFFRQIKRLFSSADNDKQHLRPGMAINIKISTSPCYTLSLIKKVEDNYILIFIPQKLKQGSFNTNDEVTCKLIQSNCEYLITGVIADIQDTAPSYIKVRVDKTEKHTNKRKSKRYEINYSASISIYGSYLTTSANVTNISSTGIFLSVQKNVMDFGIGTNIRINLQPDRNDSIEFESIIRRRVEGNFLNGYGLEISKIDSKNKILLDKLINSLENEINNVIMSFTLHHHKA